MCNATEKPNRDPAVFCNKTTRRWAKPICSHCCRYNSTYIQTKCGNKCSFFILFITYLYLCFRACRQHHIPRRSLPVCELAPERPLSVRPVLQELCGARGRTKPRGEHPFSQTLCLRLRAVRQDAHLTERHELSSLYQTQEARLNFTRLSTVSF